MVYSDKDPLTYILAISHWTWVDHQTCQIQFHHSLPLKKSNINADALSQIPWDQNIEADTAGAIFKAIVDGPEALLDVYACHKEAISFLILESPSTLMTPKEWVQAQKANPAK